MGEEGGEEERGGVDKAAVCGKFAPMGIGGAAEAVKDFLARRDLGALACCEPESEA